MTDFASPSTRWTALVNRDQRAREAFVYAVKSTGIYCRPTCQARLARRANVEFFDSALLAAEAGFRACKRCRPGSSDEDPTTARISAICQKLTGMGTTDEIPRLEELAAEAGLTKHHFHRTFKRATGKTPKEFVLSCRNEERNSETSDRMSCQLSLNSDSDCFDQPMLFWSERRISLTQQKEQPIVTDFESYSFLEPCEAIWYDHVPTAYGILLVAFQNQAICVMDLVNSVGEALDILVALYPPSLHPLHHIKCEGEMEGQRGHAFNSQIRNIVDALERPTGRMLNLPLTTALRLQLAR